MKSLIVFLAITCLFSEGASSDDAIGGGDAIVYRKAFDADREIVVLRTVPVDIKVLSGLLASNRLKDTLKDFHSAFVSVYNIRFELRSKGKPPLVLWTTLTEDGWYDFEKGYDVLDIGFEPNFIDIAAAQFGAVSLWRVNLVSGVVSASEIDVSQWTTGAGIVHRDRKNAEARWGRSSDGKKLTIEVGELGTGSVSGESRALYEQVGEEWKFRLVKSWDAPAAPATQPAK